MTESTEEYVGNFAQLLRFRASLARQQDTLDAEKEEAIKQTKSEIATLRMHLDALLKPFREREDWLEGETLKVVSQLEDGWKENDKTQRVDSHIIRMRDLKSIEIIDREALIEELHRIGKLALAVKSFDNKRLMGLADVDMLGEGTVRVVVKHSISCSIDKDATLKTYPGMKGAE